MKKSVFPLCAGCLMIFDAAAEEAFFDDLLVSKEMQQEMETDQERESGQLKAGELLDTRPVLLKIDPIKKSVKEETVTAEPAPVILEPAPFGLKWLASIAQTREQDVLLSAVETKDSPQTYQATHLPKPVSAFQEVLVSFGENDALWRIAAYGRRITDDSKASKGVAQYRKYYEMLAKKYGNAQEFYEPVVVNVEEKVDSGDGTSSIKVRQEKMEIGADGFLEKLVSGEAVLYATFENGKVGVTLALLADGKQQTYLAIDYQNLTASKIENDEIYDAL
jgi:hypothetical protein